MQALVLRVVASIFTFARVESMEASSSMGSSSYSLLWPSRSFGGSTIPPGNYRVIQQVPDLCWVDFDFGCSVVCQTLFGVMGRMCKAAEQHEWNIKIVVNPTQVRDLLNHPVCFSNQNSWDVLSDFI